MIRRSLNRLLLLFIFSLGSCATNRVAMDLVAALDGTWEGTIKISNDPEDFLKLRLLIDRRSARVWTYVNEDWLEVKPGEFRIDRHKSNAVIFATDSDVDSDGSWVESWAIIATPRSTAELQVVWSRAVNNLALPLDNKSSKFNTHAAGVLARSSWNY